MLPPALASPRMARLRAHPGSDAVAKRRRHAGSSTYLALWRMTARLLCLVDRSTAFSLNRAAVESTATRIPICSFFDFDFLIFQHSFLRVG